MNTDTDNLNTLMADYTQAIERATRNEFHALEKKALDEVTRIHGYGQISDLALSFCRAEINACAKKRGEYFLRIGRMAA